MIKIRFISGFELDLNLTKNQFDNYSILDLKQMIFEQNQLWTDNNEELFNKFCDKPFVCRQQLIYNDVVLENDSLIHLIFNGNEHEHEHVELDIIISDYPEIEYVADVPYQKLMKRYGDNFFIFFTSNQEDSSYLFDAFCLRLDINMNEWECIHFESIKNKQFVKKSFEIFKNDDVDLVFSFCDKYTDDGDIYTYIDFDITIGHKDNMIYMIPCNFVDGKQLNDNMEYERNNIYYFNFETLIWSMQKLEITKVDSLTNLTYNNVEVYDNKLYLFGTRPNNESNESFVMVHFPFQNKWERIPNSNSPYLICDMRGGYFYSVHENNRVIYEMQEIGKKQMFDFDSYQWFDFDFKNNSWIPYEHNATYATYEA